MNESVEQLFDELISDFNKNDKIGEGNESFNIREKVGNKWTNEDILNNINKNDFSKYTEYSLSSLYITDERIHIDEDNKFQDFLNVITKASDVNNIYKWIDSYYKYDSKEELDILSPKAQRKEYIFREYLEPFHLKELCLLRKYEKGAILKSSEKSKVDVNIVSEYIVHNTYKQIMKSFGYYLSHKIYIKAHIFHNKYGNSDHIIVLILQHFKDENFKQPLFHDRALVQIKSYSNDNKYSELTQKNLLHYAEIFKPFVSLRKLNYNFVEEFKDKIMFGI